MAFHLALAVALILLALFLYLRLVHKADFAEALALVVEAFGRILTNPPATYADLVEIATEIWFAHGWPAGRPLGDPTARPQELRQAGLLLQSLVARHLDEPAATARFERVSRESRLPHPEVLKEDPLGFAKDVQRRILQEVVPPADDRED